MKKVILMAAVVCATALVSCSSKTCYKCVGGTVTGSIATEYCDDIVTEAAMASAKAGCEYEDGTWTKQ